MEEKVMGKKFWRCTVCGDIHYGNSGPELCQTCQQSNKYAETDAEEAKRVMGL